MTVEAVQHGQSVDEAAHRAAGALRAELRKHFAGRSGFTLDAHFSAPPGITILFGASGAGKSTVLQLLAGLLKPDSGRITVGDRLLFDSAQHVDLHVAQRQIGYVFQELALFPHLSVQRNIQYGLATLPPEVREQRADTICETFRISHLRRRRPSEISGGERQRVALARALVTEPGLLLLDEPLAALDAPTKSHIIADLRSWNHTHQIPILYVTHSHEEVFALGERVIVLDTGTIVAEGTPQQVLDAPRQETIAQLAGFENIFDATVLATHPDLGTTTCALHTTGAVPLSLEVPLSNFQPGDLVRIAVRAGDILLAIAPPEGLSARNIIPGKLLSVSVRDRVAVADVDCGMRFIVHLTLAALQSLALQAGQHLWLVLKTHSCHLLEP